MGDILTFYTLVGAIPVVQKISLQTLSGASSLMLMSALSVTAIGTLI